MRLKLARWKSKVRSCPGEISAQAQMQISTLAEAGNYTLSLGIETRSINVWTMISVKVVKANATNHGLLPQVAGLSVTLILILSIYVLIRRKRL
jgi:hypothetical protein